MNEMNVLNVVDKEKCCGCSACVAICPKQCISMKEDENGFQSTHIDAKECIDCGQCEKVCPVLHRSDERIPLSVWAAKNPNEQERFASSSGGVFLMLSDWTIKKGGVVFGARFDENWEVMHDYAETMEVVDAFRGSKYVQSRMGDCYRKAEGFLKADRWVLFTGTQCQIAGLKNFLKKDYEKLVCVDVICHGVPSPLVWRNYLSYKQRHLAAADGKNSVGSSLNEMPSIKGISFRDKSKGWKKFGLVFRFRRFVGETEKFGLSSINSSLKIQYTA